MQINTATVNFWLDTRREKIDETYPVKLRITHKRKYRLYGTPYSYTKEDFDKIMQVKTRGKYKKYKELLDIIEDEAKKAIDEITNFTFDKFEKKMFGGNGDETQVYIAFTNHIKALENNGQVSTASTYTTALKSFKEFMPHEELKFEDIDVKFLEAYENWMKSDGKTLSTISINTRCLRRLFNLAINNEIIKSDIYPFGRKESNKYSPPQSTNFKRALNMEEIKKIFKYESQNEAEMKCKDFWIFSYLCNGMNMADICRLKYENITPETIYYFRYKTAHNRKQRPILIQNTQDTKSIIDKWGQPKEDDDTYVFDILEKGLTPSQELARIKQFTKQVNKYIKRIAENVGIEGDVSTYWARHSYATILKNSNSEINYISESLGHSSIKTTMNYLSGFDEKTRKENAEKLTDW